MSQVFGGWLSFQKMADVSSDVDLLVCGRLHGLQAVLWLFYRVEEAFYGMSERLSEVSLDTRRVLL